MQNLELINRTKKKQIKPIQREPENCGIGNDIKAIIKRIWCCYKANSFTQLNHLINETWSVETAQLPGLDHVQ